MTQLASTSPALSRLADQLDLVAQKHRVRELLRGLIWLSAIVAIATLIAAAVAHLSGAGTGARLTLLAWIAVLAAATWHFVIRPLIRRPDQAEIARLIEARVGGLHSGLTNAIHLAARDDLASNPWLPEVYDEIARTAESRPIGSAVRLAELRPLLLRVLAALVLCAGIGLWFRAPLAHGWQQLFSPTAFVPKIGEARIVSVQPGDLQVVLGKPLEITVVADVPRTIATPPLKLAFDALPDDPASPVPLPKDAVVLPAGSEDVAADVVRHRYLFRLDRLDRSLRYRVEVAGTQSVWFSAHVIREVRLTGLTLSVVPPTYLREPTKQFRLTAADIGKSPVAVPEGSVVELTASLDTPVEGAVLQAAMDGATGDNTTAEPPIAMTSSAGGKQFAATLTVVRDTSVSILLTDSAGQAMFKLPPEPLRIAIVKDAPPTIEMRSPKQDVSVAPAAAIKIDAVARDDRGLTRGRIRVSVESPQEPRESVAGYAAEGSALAPVLDIAFPFTATQGELTKLIELPASARVHGTVVRVQVEAVDNRDLGPTAAKAWASLRPGVDAATLAGPQTTRSPIYQIRLQDPAVTSQNAAMQTDALRKRLLEMLQTQRTLHNETLGARASSPAVTAGDASRGGAAGLSTVFASIASGQRALRDTMRLTADTFDFAPDDRVVQKTLQMLVIGPAADAIDVATRLTSEPSAAARQPLSAELQSRQRRIIDTLESLLATLGRQSDPATQPTDKRSGDLSNRADEMKKLDEALKDFIKQQQKVLDQTAPLAKKPVDSFDDADKKLMEELAMAQEKLDAFMQQKVNDFSKLAEQDMANSSLLKELMEVYVEVTMAKDALKQKAAEIAVAAEQAGIDKAKEIQANLEKWLPHTPDRTKWTMEDPLNKADLPLAELPKELEDLIGELLEQEEDLFEQLEDANANWHGSADKGIGWDAADGPISNMTAKGVTGNQLPNNNEMGGRAGEGRSGKSQGEFVEETATGKGGRRTPTRLDPSSFQKGQVKDQSKDPTGGATGGGKVSGQGGEGLEGPVPPQQKEAMQRLAQKQAQLRNAAERLQLQYQLGRYDNFKLLESIALMRRVEADLAANRYATALRRKEMLLDRLDTSRLLVGAEVHVKQDTTPTPTSKERKQIGDAMKGELPPAWKDALKAYYERLSREE